MSLTPAELFLSLEEGDLLMIPVEMPLSKEAVTLFSTVLRLGQEGELYLSCPDPNRPTPWAYPDLNPFRWDPKKGTLVDKNGDVPRWYSIDIALERGGARKQARQYAEVPRIDYMGLNADQNFTDADFKRCLEKSDRLRILEGILKNGEAGSVGMQILLALNQLGVQFGQNQGMHIAYFVEAMAAHAMVAEGKRMAMHVHIVEVKPGEPPKEDKASAKG